ncbi:TetR/AcrR family transcriptional regulator [uncultured Dokdonia sp.]|uniref:TetR/AcrR family transcriptional regulator n=1 Tax=uncultured Dokdonia sp. TaxID=575653 RepID=UPI002609DF54|nr:TetR/AcrR family transcriptional regulator [uncultured Dokdonia sp.]
MRPQKIDDTALLARLIDVFRSKGYEGSSLNDLAASAGLKKASLYHRFPGGKEEIVTAVLEHTTTWGKTHIEETLADQTVPARQRLEKVIDNIDALYAQGTKTCLFRALSMDTGVPTLDSLIQIDMNNWVQAFKTFAQEIGFTSEVAHQKALQTLINIQGSLIITKGLNDTTIFKNTLHTIKYLYYPTL